MRSQCKEIAVKHVAWEPIFKGLKVAGWVLAHTEDSAYLLAAKTGSDEARSRRFTAVLAVADDAGAEIARDGVADLAAEARAGKGHFVRMERRQKGMME